MQERHNQQPTPAKGCACKQGMARHRCIRCCKLIMSSCLKMRTCKGTACACCECMAWCAFSHLREGISRAQYALRGSASQPCCVPSPADAATATSRDMATTTAFPACQREVHACVLDPGSADYFGTCGHFTVAIRCQCTWVCRCTNMQAWRMPPS